MVGDWSHILPNQSQTSENNGRVITSEYLALTCSVNLPRSPLLHTSKILSYGRQMACKHLRHALHVSNTEPIRHVRVEQIPSCIRHTGMLCSYMQHDMDTRCNNLRCTPITVMSSQREADLPGISGVSVSAHVYPESGAG